MSWLNRVRNAIPFITKRETPDHLWHKCKGCGQMIFHRDHEKDLRVCQQCGHHMRMPASHRFDMLFDEGRFEVSDLPETISDPLKFRDKKKYTDRLKEARGRTGASDALGVALGKIGGPLAKKVLTSLANDGDANLEEAARMELQDLEFDEDPQGFLGDF